MNSYSVDILAQTIFEKELEQLLLQEQEQEQEQKEKEPIIEYIRQRITEIKIKYAR